MKGNFSVCQRVLWTAGLALVILISVWISTVTVLHAEVSGPGSSGGTAPYASFLFLFDPVTSAFITIPLSSGALPTGVAVTGTHPTHVWVTESGLNRIAQVVFTDTTSYTLAAEYPIAWPTNSRPFLITVDESEVWFTERDANRVGRLNAATGQIDEFSGHGLPANAGLADLNVAPDGSLWVAGQYAKRLYRLVITSTLTNDYAFQEYLTGVTISSTVGPLGIDIIPGNSPLSYQVAFASPEGNRIGLLTPGSRQTLIAGTIRPGYAPTDIVYDAAHQALWFSEPGGNALGLSFQSTLGNIPAQTDPVTRPTSLSRVAGDTLWMTQQDAVGQIARMVYTPPGQYDFTSFPLPQSGLMPTGIALAEDGQIWTVAYAPTRVYLPLIRY